MRALTPAERRGALWVVALFLLGAAYDGWRSRSGPAPSSPEVGETPARAVASAPALPRQDGSGVGAERHVGAGASAGAGPPPVGAAVIDLNRASAADLETLDGIGPTLARRIVEHRAAHGPFRSVDELLAVRGIGPRLMARVRPRVTAGP